MGLLTRNRKAEKVDAVNLPRHIAVIMDGNGRWAKKRGLPRTAGHAVGAETFRRIATHCRDLGVEYLTVYAFSTENWKRPPEEVSAIMSLLDKYLHEAIETMERDHIRMAVFGDTSVLSPSLQELIAGTREISTHYSGFQANICVNYGSRAEIVRAARACVESGKEITEDALSGEMYSAGIPDPDLVIRPGGEYRLSNFLLWQSAYAELYFTDTLWPDFTESDLDAAIISYQHRSRRYGGVNSK
ncbi:MAG: di-trans,poly-cis-decaprenylcistransferase [Oscillospiraceae bacterium]|nr:di-trans,poly-cis-decaprenylcistransferase [Oscillospiraceae bacterium]